MGIGITPEGYLAVSDRYNHCIRLYQYKRDLNEGGDSFEIGDHQVSFPVVLKTLKINHKKKIFEIY